MRLGAPQRISNVKLFPLHGVCRPLILYLGFLQIMGGLENLFQLERKLRAQLLHAHPTALGIKHVPMASDKDEIALVVKGDHLAARKLGDVGEEGDKQAADAVAQLGDKVVEDQLGRVAGGAPVVVDLLAEPDGGQLEDGRRSLGELYNAQSIYGEGEDGSETVATRKITRDDDGIPAILRDSLTTTRCV